MHRNKENLRFLSLTHSLIPFETGSLVIPACAFMMVTWILRTSFSMAPIPACTEERKFVLREKIIYHSTVFYLIHFGVGKCDFE